MAIPLKRPVLVYRVVKANTHADLEEDVQSLLADGWELRGGVTVCTNPSNVQIWGQAMTRREYHDGVRL